MPLAGTYCHTSNFCRHFSSSSASGRLLHYISSAGTFFSDLRLPAQVTLMRPGSNVLKLLLTWRFCFSALHAISNSAVSGKSNREKLAHQLYNKVLKFLETEGTTHFCVHL